MKIVPKNGRVLIKPLDAPSQTKGGLYLPDTAEKQTLRGEVLAVADDATEDVAVGDHIIYREFGGTNVTVEGEEYILISEEDLVVKFVDSDEIPD